MAAKEFTMNISHGLGSAGHGYWGPVTATLDWCEQNYQFSHYIAEMANSFSNLVTIWFALHGARMTIKNDLPKRYLWGHLGFALVGLGSFAFHASLLFEAQLADELPMILVATYSLWMLYDTTPGWNIWNSQSLSKLGALVTFTGLFTWSYYVSRNPLYHQAVFASLLIAGGLRTTYLLQWSPKYLHRVPPKTKSTILHMFWLGGGLFALAFGIWNLDNIFCSGLTRYKVALGWPGAFLLEGHSWWHVLTAAGTYLMIQGVSYLTLLVKDDHRKFTVGYSHGLPHVARVRATPVIPSSEKGSRE